MSPIECHVCKARSTITHEPYCSFRGLPEHHVIQRLEHQRDSAQETLKALQEDLKARMCFIGMLSWELDLPKVSHSGEPDYFQAIRGLRRQIKDAQRERDEWKSAAEKHERHAFAAETAGLGQAELIDELERERDHLRTLLDARADHTEAAIRERDEWRERAELEGSRAEAAERERDESREEINRLRKFAERTADATNSFCHCCRFEARKVLGLEEPAQPPAAGSEECDE